MTRQTISSFLSCFQLCFFPFFYTYIPEHIVFILSSVALLSMYCFNNFSSENTLVKVLRFWETFSDDIQKEMSGCKKTPHLNCQFSPMWLEVSYIYVGKLIIQTSNAPRIVELKSLSQQYSVYRSDSFWEVSRAVCMDLCTVLIHDKDTIHWPSWTTPFVAWLKYINEMSEWWNSLLLYR